jgi:hypothetical protein
MQQDRYVIRSMTRPEFDLALDWAAAEGWNPGLHDAAAFHAADPEGFLIGLLDGQPVAMISAVRYGSRLRLHRFLHRATELPRARATACRSGTPRWRAWRAARSASTAWWRSRTTTASRASCWPGTTRASRESVAGRALPDDAIVPLPTLPFDAVMAYDRPFFPDDRLTFLRAWIDQPDAAALGLLQGGRLAGYGMLRPCRSGFKIGPLFADSPALAERLFVALRAQAPEGAPLFLDIPVPHAAALDLVQRHHMTKGFETARMYTGIAPQLPLERLYGVTSFELG